MTNTQINLNTQDYRTTVKPRVYTCECGQRAVYRQYDHTTGESKNVCLKCKEAR